MQSLSYDSACVCHTNCFKSIPNLLQDLAVVLCVRVRVCARVCVHVCVCARACVCMHVECAFTTSKVISLSTDDVLESSGNA
jgi:hypothetical protein